jgi:hypothetical protein
MPERALMLGAFLASDISPWVLKPGPDFFHQSIVHVIEGTSDQESGE